MNGTLMASFCVESFSVDRLAHLSKKEIASRVRSLVIPCDAFRQPRQRTNGFYDTKCGWAYRLFLISSLIQTLLSLLIARYFLIFVKTTVREACAGP